jgi:hypothetical protein
LNPWSQACQASALLHEEKPEPNTFFTEGEMDFCHIMGIQGHILSSISYRSLRLLGGFLRQEKKQEKQLGNVSLDQHGDMEIARKIRV